MKKIFLFVFIIFIRVVFGQSLSFKPDIGTYVNWTNPSVSNKTDGIDKCGSTVNTITAYVTITNNEPVAYYLVEFSGYLQYPPMWVSPAGKVGIDAGKSQTFTFTVSDPTYSDNFSEILTTFGIYYQNGTLITTLIGPKLKPFITDNNTPKGLIVNASNITDIGFTLNFSGAYEDGFGSEAIKQYYVKVWQTTTPSNVLMDGCTSSKFVNFSAKSCTGYSYSVYAINQANYNGTVNSGTVASAPVKNIVLQQKDYTSTTADQINFASEKIQLLTGFKYSSNNSNGHLFHAYITSNCPGVLKSEAITSNNNLPDNLIKEKQKLISNSPIDYHQNVPSENKTISVYPNPTTGIVNITIPNNEESTHVSITDMTGKLVKTLTLHSDNNSVDLSDLPKGIYIINVVNDKTHLQEKLMLQ